jgi:hypothetical protein
MEPVSPLKAAQRAVDSLVFGDAGAAPDVFALKDRLHDLFSRYGEVARLDLVGADQGSSRRVMCFLRMRTAQQEQALVEALGLGRFGGDLVMVLALDSDAAAGLTWTASPAAARSAGWR